MIIESNYTGVYSYFNSSITSQITADEFADIWKQQIIPSHGTITKIVRTREANESGFVSSMLHVIFQK